MSIKMAGSWSFGEVLWWMATQRSTWKAAAVLGQYVNILGVRSFPSLTDQDKDYSEYVINAFVKYSGVPVVSLESATLHPLQSLADIITIERDLVARWRFPFGKPGVERKPKVVPYRTLRRCHKQYQLFCAMDQCPARLDFVIAHPEEYHLDEKFTKGATITHNQNDALNGADFVYVKNWSSYEQYGRFWTPTRNSFVTNKRLNSPIRKSHALFTGSQKLLSLLMKFWMASKFNCCSTGMQPRVGSTNRFERVNENS